MPVRLPARALVLALFAFTSFSCDTKSPDPAADGTYDVYTTFYPLTEFAQRIAGDRANVVCPLPKDEDPIYWKPSREIVEAYRGADLVVINGAALEKWINRAGLPKSRVLDTAASFKDQHLRYESQVTHSHGGGEHTHAGIDGHTWVDPVLAREQAKTIADRLAKDLPDHADEFQSRYRELAAELDALSEAFGELKTLQSEWSFASHPAYNYLAKRHGWKLHSFDLDPESPVTDEQLAEIRAELENKPTQRILWESQPSPAVQAQLAELGLESIVFSPIEGEPDEGETFFTIMRTNLATLTASCK